MTSRADFINLNGYGDQFRENYDLLPKHNLDDPEYQLQTVIRYLQV